MFSAHTETQSRRFQIPLDWIEERFLYKLRLHVELVCEV